MTFERRATTEGGFVLVSTPLEGDGFLSVDGRIIYHMTGFSVGLRTGT